MTKLSNQYSGYIGFDYFVAVVVVEMISRFFTLHFTFCRLKITRIRGLHYVRYVNSVVVVVALVLSFL